ncbi:hypothetical protein CDV31_016899, partial [Fusarium ambrosium]
MLIRRFLDLTHVEHEEREGVMRREPTLERALPNLAHVARVMFGRRDETPRPGLRINTSMHPSAASPMLSSAWHGSPVPTGNSVGNVFAKN